MIRIRQAWRDVMEILTTMRRAPMCSDKVICVTLASDLGYKSVRFTFHEEFLLKRKLLTNTLLR